MGVDGVVDAFGECGDRAFHLVVFERCRAPTPVAEQVMVVVAAGVGGLVAGGAITDVEALDQSELVEGFDGR